MLLERAQEMTQDIKRIGDLRTQQDKVRAIQARIDQFQETLSNLRPVWAVIKALRERGCEVSIQKQNALRISGELKTLLARAEKHPEELSEAEALREIRRFLDELSRSTRDQCRDAWQAYVSKQIIDVDEHLLTVLSRIPGFDDQVAEIRRALKSLQNWDSLPQSADRVNQFDLLSNRLRKAWASLQGDAIPSEVIDFLREAGAGGATLDLLTPTVREWIAEQDLEEQFYVAVRATS